MLAEYVNACIRNLSYSRISSFLPFVILRRIYKQTIVPILVQLFGMSAEQGLSINKAGENVLKRCAAN
jgi:hypothetical protein